MLMAHGMDFSQSFLFYPENGRVMLDHFFCLNCIWLERRGSGKGGQVWLVWSHAHQGRELGEGGGVGRGEIEGEQGVGGGGGGEGVGEGTEEGVGQGRKEHTL